MVALAVFSWSANICLSGVFISSTFIEINSILLYMIRFAPNPSLVNSGASLLCPNYQRWGSKLLTTKLINFPAFTCQVLNLTEFDFCYHYQRQTKGGNPHLFQMLIICKSTLLIEISTGNVFWQKKILAHTLLHVLFQKMFFSPSDVINSWRHATVPLSASDSASDTFKLCENRNKVEAIALQLCYTGPTLRIQHFWVVILSMLRLHCPQQTF